MKKFILCLTNLLIFTSLALSQFHNETKPMYSDTLFYENWSSGSFNTNQWQLFDSVALTIPNNFGNPAPSVNFNLFYPQAYITSKEIPGTNNYTELRYDYYVSDSSDKFWTLAVWILNDSLWHTMDYIADNGGSMPWTTRVVNISDYCHNNFRIRFIEFSEAFDTAHLNIDNIIIGSFPLGISENQNADLIINPNPASYSLDLILKNFENLNTQIIILDVTGKVVYEEKFIPATADYIKNINVDNLSKGIYFCELRSNEKNLIRKVIIE
jgi:hypothetical protein